MSTVQSKQASLPFSYTPVPECFERLCDAIVPAGLDPFGEWADLPALNAACKFTAAQVKAVQ